MSKAGKNDMKSKIVSITFTYYRQFSLCVVVPQDKNDHVS